ncbi:Myosin-XVIIIa [Wickerhamomyces ciferrii]|uniref:Myosin-XVIIIa n=1 Tax=Wickerhamomyces ciferrii (strain ATCC 14091 / BCRC 22168 / CBS 111 / JCM 3599 / NBRC 0793 / NRRL Y-1031 F-60-10) TaxID=1206466 RepID=K0KL41_WICCF|nr:Myosin-XVIIIa [Wickerhamomyces ciferrii]CCH42892.1 Myosin-XVIIIa [Wickerhamomyces ciferrii]
METLIQTLTNRASKVNFELNHSDKYLEHFKNDEYYNKLGNRLDDLLRISYFLTKFLTSTPPKYQKIESTNQLQNGEELMDYGEEKRETPAPIEYIDKDFTLYDLEDLPTEIESEFDFNYFAFYSFLSYLKPSFYFIHDHEIVPLGRSETKKERVTRVLTNIVQLLTFTRSIQINNESNFNYKDSQIIISSLFFRFEKLFLIQHEETIYDNYIFFQNFAGHAAKFTLHSLLYDNEPIEDLKKNIAMLFEIYSNIPECDDYNMFLQGYKYNIENALETSETTEDFHNKIKETIPLSVFKESLMKLSHQLATDAIKEALELKPIDLNKSFLSVNYDYEIQLREDEISKIELKTKEQVELEQSKIRKELINELESKDREINIMKTEQNVKDETIEQLTQQLNKELNNKSSNSRSFQNIDEFKQTYPNIFQDISIQSFKTSSQKFQSNLIELEAEISNLKVSERKLKNRNKELESQLKEFQKQQDQNNLDDEDLIETTQFQHSHSHSHSHSQPQPHPHPHPGSVRGSIGDDYGPPGNGSNNGYYGAPRPAGGSSYVPPQPRYNGFAGGGGYRNPRYREDYL